MGRFKQTGELIYDRQTGLMWTQNAALTEFPLDWDEAFAFIETLNRENTNGYHDWKLPNRSELFSIVSHAAINPCLPTDHPFKHVFPGYYWTSTSCTRLPDQAWYIHLGGARVFKGMKYNAYMVWPVRVAESRPNRPFCTGQHHCYDVKGVKIDCDGTGQDGQYQAGVKYPAPRFEADDHWVHDRATGLVWMKDANIHKTMLDWAGALDLIAQMNDPSQGEVDRWRMPTIRELETLVDLGTHSPALPHRHPFSHVQDFYWSATTSAYDTAYAWALYLRDGIVGVGYKQNPEFYLWPVRDAADHNPT